MDDDTARTNPEDLAALHHPVRRRMLEFLNLNGPSTVGAIAAGLGQQVGSISHHMTVHTTPWQVRLRRNDRRPEFVAPPGRYRDPQPLRHRPLRT